MLPIPNLQRSYVRNRIFSALPLNPSLQHALVQARAGDSLGLMQQFDGSQGGFVSTWVVSGHRDLFASHSKFLSNFW